MFKTIVMVTALVLGIAGCAQQQQGRTGVPLATLPDNREARFNQIRDELKADRDAGKISDVQYSERLVSLSESIYPDDLRFQSFLKYRLFLAHEVAAGRMTQPEFDYRLAEKAAEHENALKAERTQASQPPAVQTSAPDMRPYIFLQSMGNSFRNAYPARPTNCTTTSVGGVYTTNCN